MSEMFFRKIFFYPRNSSSIPKAAKPKDAVKKTPMHEKLAAQERKHAEEEAAEKTEKLIERAKGEEAAEKKKDKKAIE